VLGLAIAARGFATVAPCMWRIALAAWLIRSISASPPSRAAAREKSPASCSRRGQVEGGNAQEGGGRGSATITDRSVMPPQ
jgi:hypothetical protein